MNWKIYPMLPVFALLMAMALFRPAEAAEQAEPAETQVVEEIMTDTSKVGLVGFVTVISLGIIWTVYRFRREQREEVFVAEGHAEVMTGDLKTHIERRPHEVSGRQAEIHAGLFVFEGMSRLQDELIRSALNQVSTEELATALHGASESLQAKIFDNVPKERARICQESLEGVETIGVESVLAARRKIEKVVRGLESDNE